MSKYCPICGRDNFEDTDKFCPKCEDGNGMPVRLLPKVNQTAGITVGDAAAIAGGIHTTSDSHNVHNESHIVNNNVTNIAAQKSEMEILQDKKNLYLAECKRAYEDNVLEQSEIIALEECRMRLGLDEVTARDILESVRLLADRNTRKTSLNPIAKTKLKILSDNLLNNNIQALKDQIGTLEAIVNKFEHDELSRKYFLALAVLNPKKCIEMKESSQIDSYWKSYWCYLAYLKEGKQSEAETLLAGMDRFADYPEDNITILAIAGALISGNEAEAKEYLSAVTGDYTPELQRFVDSIYLTLDADTAQEMGADEFSCAFYLVNLFGQKDPKVKAAEQKAKEEAERKAREEAERKAREEAERIEREERERAEREEAERLARIEAERKAREEAESKAREEAERIEREERERAEREEAERIARQKEAEHNAKIEYDRKSAPYAIIIESINNNVLAMLTGKAVFNWDSATFKKKTASLPYTTDSYTGRDKAEEICSQLKKGGFVCSIKNLDGPNNK